MTAMGVKVTLFFKKALECLCWWKKRCIFASILNSKINMLNF